MLGPGFKRHAGGGKIARLTDPDGYRVEVVAGQAKGEVIPLPADQPVNTASAKPRFRQTVRLEARPAHVKRIGHAVLKVRDFRTSEQWYKDRFGFITSDEVEAAKWIKAHMKKPVAGFIAGRTAPKGKRMGHAGAIIGGADDTAQAKIEALKACGIAVAESPADLGSTMAKALGL